MQYKGAWDIYKQCYCVSEKVEIGIFRHLNNTYTGSVLNTVVINSAVAQHYCKLSAVIFWSLVLEKMGLLKFK